MIVIRASQARDERPVRILLACLVVLAVSGVATPHSYNALPAENLLDGALVLTTLLAFRRNMRVLAVQTILIALAYVSVKYALSLARTPPNYFDFIKAYKAYFYLIPIAVYSNVTFDVRRLTKVVDILLVCFAVKYAYAILLGYSARPGVFNENNFELPMLLGLYYLGNRGYQRFRLLRFLTLAGIVLISGSRSAAIALVIVYLAVYVRFRSQALMLHLAGIVGVAFFVDKLFASRSSAGLSGTDRFNFLQVFLREVHPWPWWEFFTGSYPLTPLSASDCGALSFYSTLFSHAHNGECYSVILHAFLLRAIFDQGILGLLLLLGLLLNAMRRSGRSRKDALALLCIMLASAASVGAFNNVFVALTLAIACALRGERVADEGAPLAGAPSAQKIPTLQRYPLRAPL